MLQVSSCTSSVEVENSFLESSGDGDGVMFSVELDGEGYSASISDWSVEVVTVYEGGRELTVVQMKHSRHLDPLIRYSYSEVCNSSIPYSHLLVDV